MWRVLVGGGHIERFDGSVIEFTTKTEANQFVTDNNLSDIATVIDTDAAASAQVLAIVNVLRSARRPLTCDQIMSNLPAGIKWTHSLNELVSMGWLAQTNYRARCSKARFGIGERIA
jgi:primosomal protein N'